MPLTIPERPPESSSATEQPNEQKSAGSDTQSAELIKLAIEDGATFFRSEDETAFCTLELNGIQQTLSVKSRGFRNLIGQKYYSKLEKPPQAQALADAIGHLEGVATFRSAGSQKVGKRVASGPNDSIIIDLVDSRWRVVQITKDGWALLDKSPVPMIRQKGMWPLPEPSKSGDLSLLWKFVNAPTEELQSLMIGWLLTALRPEGPYPVLILLGGQGCGKSLTSRVLRNLTDPSVALLRTMPTDERDLLITARNSWVLCYDNLSGLSPRLSDCLCRLSTGGGSSCR